MAEGNRHLVYGIHAVTALLERAPERVLEMWLNTQRSDARMNELRVLAQRSGVRPQEVTEPTLIKLTGDVAHQGVVIAIRPQPLWDESQLLAALDTAHEPAFVLVLDGVTDPQNLGACLRTADAAGVHALVLPKDRSATLDAAARKVAAGAAEFVPIAAVTNLARTLDVLKSRGIWVVGAAGEAEKTLYATDLKGPLAMVLGAEGEGMRRLTRERCDFLFRIPMAGQIESLNVSVATGIALFEARRQRMA